jgi:hypothetical protein
MKQHLLGNVIAHTNVPSQVHKQPEQANRVWVTAWAETIRLGNLFLSNQFDRAGATIPICAMIFALNGFDGICATA